LPRLITKYFTNLDSEQEERFMALQELYHYWNDQINVISRKDVEELYERHVLHSLGIAKLIQFSSNSNILDIGTGGGFPGIPLAILFPEVHFHLVDAIGKKIKVVNEVAKALKLENVSAEHQRAEKVKGKYDFIVSRAVTRLAGFMPWTNGKISETHNNTLKNGVLALKGGDLNEELSEVARPIKIYPLSTYFEEPFFETKQIVHVQLTTK
jgi:16S rRNA (guanine527-N7)-methyltransferase